jgi:hypothetical protein
VYAVGKYGWPGNGVNEVWNHVAVIPLYVAVAGFAKIFTNSPARSAGPPFWAR